MILLTFSFYLLLVVLLTWLSSRGIVLILIISWWGIWNFLSYFSISGIQIIDIDTQFVYFLFFASITAAYISFERISQKWKNRSFNFSNVKSLYKILFWLAICVLLPVQIFFVFRAIYILTFIMPPGMYRNDVFGLITGTSTLFFNSNALALLHSLVIGPFQYIYLFTGLSYYLLRRKLGLILIGVTLIILDAVMMFGRFGYHFLIVTLLFGLIFTAYFSGISKLTRHSLKLIAAFSFLVLFSLFITLNKGNEGMIEILKTFVVTYHTESFAIFDLELRNPNSILHNYTYGLSTIGGVERYWTLVLNKLSYPIVSQTDIVGAYLHQNFVIGQDSYGRPLLFNAFGSIFFTMYRDGGLVAIFGFGTIFGFLLSYYSISINTRDPYRFSMLLGLVYILIYGIFQPSTLGPMLPAFVFIFLLHLCSQIYSRVKD
ncbi:O-antigen polymerase [Leptospira perdikensis]|uniref:Oligosaccharide repeat unit polymerase n=1 Tax=Leptospira perdikensis TaxID=2484948 RepID=A0A4R9JDC5_9LEPT|nr:O-antigen polymerase [Leptospira perdikensis]TGL37121.1 oligosaccharide repeat unit polymerase [Leptospira perdikensis]